MRDPPPPNDRAPDAAGIATLDVRGLRCPAPVIRAEAVLRALAPGARLVVVADDPIARVDLPHFCRLGGHTVVEIPPESGVSGAEICVFLVTRGENPPAAAIPPLAER